MKRTGLTAMAAIAAIAALSAFVGRTSAATIFADFNTTEGTFTSAPNGSGTTNFTAASTADRTTTDSFEGAGSEKLDLIQNTTPAANRVRFLSGLGTVANNAAFNVTAGTDGFIGYYYKVVGTLTNAVGTTMSINLDGAAGATADMDGGVPKPINADGAWHLVEWNLDLATDWGAVGGIGGGGHSPLVNSTHTIDSIYLQNNTAAAGAHFEVLIDFVAKSDSGSIANLVPEPATCALVGIALIGIYGSFRRRVEKL
jgi:hypothetical protein